jgi:hypothetical protein
MNFCFASAPSRLLESDLLFDMLARYTRRIKGSPEIRPLDAQISKNGREHDVSQVVYM